MVNTKLKNLIERYLTLIVWYLVHNEDKDITSDQFNSVFNEIGRIEDALRQNGVSQTAIEKLIDFAEQQIKSPIEKLSKSALLRICKIIFGEGTRWADD